MRILCCLDGTNGEQIHEAVTRLLNQAELTIGLLYVIDILPQEELARRRGQLLRPRRHSGPLDERVFQAEATNAQEILRDAQQAFPAAELLQRRGRPEREIVTQASEWQADLVLICPRSPEHAGAPLGPRSVGHVARFVLDHSPCPVLLVRPRISGPLHLPPPPPR